MTPEELAEAIASALGTSLRHYMPSTKARALEVAAQSIARIRQEA